jgi:hypothetical protein
MQLFLVSVEAPLLQATEVGPSYVRDIWHIGEDFELSTWDVCALLRALEGGQDEGYHYTPMTYHCYQVGPRASWQGAATWGGVCVISMMGDFSKGKERVYT